MIVGKQHEQVLALCDKDLLGKRFEEGEVCIEVRESFYNGKQLSSSEIEELLTAATNVNIVGEESVQFALIHGYLGKEDIKYVQGVPHVQIYSLS